MARPGANANDWAAPFIAPGVMFSMKLHRREFMEKSAKVLGGVAVAAPSHRSIAAANQASRKVRVAVIGLSRGMAHVEAYAALEDVEIAAVCEVDSRRLASAAMKVAESQGAIPKQEKDLRRLLEDPDIDAVSIALPNFWHTPAAVMACKAGKHVYVEKPGSHNAQEAELIVKAAAQHGMQVQMGNQRRSLPSFREGIERLKGGVIGTVRYARCWYDSNRGTIGRGLPSPVPEWLDYDLWQGPAPERPYKDNLIHYNWHWHWHWGNGELGNNGVHALDIARWGLGVDYPTHVSCLGGRYHFDDDQETPDTADVTFDFGSCGASWYGSSCLRRAHEKHAFVTFYGEGGSMAFGSSGYDIYDESGKPLETVKPDFSDLPHFRNFVDAIRNGSALNAPIADAQVSTMLCHLGNMSYRTGNQLKVDSASGRPMDNAEAGALWKRDYRPGWDVTV